MKMARFSALATVALAALVGLPAVAADAPRPATLTVTGEGSVSRPPDRAQVAFSIETTNADAATATRDNNRIDDALNAALARIGVPSTAVATNGYGLSYVPRPTRPDPANDQRYGYTVTRSVTVTLDAIDRAGAVVDAGVSAGVTNVNGVAFTLRDPHAAQRAAQTAALDDAAQQARALAGTAGVRIVRILAIAPGSTPRPMPVMRMALAASAAPTTIDPGALTVQAEVTVRYEIAPAH
jgi:uncharacterized protein YggE